MKILIIYSNGLWAVNISNSFKIFVFKISISILVAGCAVRPVPKDYATNIIPKGQGEMTATTAIVQRIRCEARYAIAKTTMGFIGNDFKELLNASSRTPDEQRVYNDVVNADGDLSFDKIIANYYKNGKFDPELGRVVRGSGDSKLAEELAVIAEFAKSGVGYLFTFEISLDNDASSGSLGFNLPFNTGTFALGVGGEYKRQRKNIRKFPLVETIEDIVLE